MFIYWRYQYKELILKSVSHYKHQIISHTVYLVKYHTQPHKNSPTRCRSLSNTRTHMTCSSLSTFSRYRHFIVHFHAAFLTFKSPTNYLILNNPIVERHQYTRRSAHFDAIHVFRTSFFKDRLIYVIWSFNRCLHLLSYLQPNISTRSLKIKY
jgi:hypothetical protein